MRHSDSDADVLAGGPVDPVYRSHHGAPTTVRLSSADPGQPGVWSELRFELNRYDENGRTGPVSVFSMVVDQSGAKATPNDLDGAELTLASARQLAAALGALTVQSGRGSAA